MTRRVVWWGRSDPDYSRNRGVRGAFRRLGWELEEFRPAILSWAHLQAALLGRPRADLIWVPCFRQRDLGAALRFGKRRGIPVIADPLISAWDKQVFERRRLAEDSSAARRLQRWESNLLRACDVVIADTPAHARFFAEHLGVAEDRIQVLWVGAEEELFHPAPARPAGQGVEALFFGSFIGLHGTRTVIEAARLCQDAPIVWRLLGDGPERPAAEVSARGLDKVRFEDAIDYTRLPQRILAADILLGVFGASAKAGRVIPNKVFQALACGRPVVTRSGEGYPASSHSATSGLTFVPPDDPVALAAAVTRLAADPDLRARSGRLGHDYFRSNFGAAVLESQLATALRRVGLT
jgi:glycosyltransferase involved in cell wall biosynthesis